MTKKCNKIDKFKTLGDWDEKTKTTRIVTSDEFIEANDILAFNNGGSWCRQTAMNGSKYKLATMTGNCKKINFLWDATDKEKETITKLFLEKCKPVKGKGNKVYYLKIFGIKELNLDRPIRQDIKDYYQKEPCAHCGKTSDLQCDHKNGLYNDPRVLNKDTQTLDDFQSLCRSCNCTKRQVEKKTRETCKRYGATNIPIMKVHGIDFIEGDEKFDPKNINALKGTYWYDPVEFHKKLEQIKMSKNKEIVL